MLVTPPESELAVTGGYETRAGTQHISCDIRWLPKRCFAETLRWTRTIRPPHFPYHFISGCYNSRVVTRFSVRLAAGAAALFTYTWKEY